MAFHHRKLLNESVIALCGTYCDINKKNATCPAICLGLCPDVCKLYSLTFPPPPLQPSPPPPLSVPNPPDKAQKLSLLLTASLAVLATAFFLFTCYIVYKFYTVWNRSRQRRLSQRRQPDGGADDDDSLDEDYGPVVDHPIWYIRTIGLQPSVINAITIVKYKKADGIVEGSDCAVCLNEFQEDETLRLLPKCNHAFHIPCIDTWLGSHTNCPMCRAPIVNNSPDPLPQDPGVHDSGRVEEVRLEVEGNPRRDTRVGIEDDPTAQIGLEVDENHDCKVDLSGLDGIQAVRRSVSMDSMSALAISAAVANAFPLQSDRSSNNELVKSKESVVNEGLARLVGSPLIESGSSSIKRSASCSAKVLLSRHSSRSRN